MVSRTFRYWTIILGVGLLLAGSMAARSTHAAPMGRGGTLTVTRLDDPIPDGCDISDCSLREAIIAANALSSNDTVINIAVEGTIGLTLSGADEDNAATGDLDLQASATLNGLSHVTIDGNELDRVFDIVLDTNEYVTFDELVITGGNVTVPVGQGGGGAIRVSGGNFTLSESTLRGNSVVGGYGGAIAVENGNTLITSSALIGNTADNAGAVFVSDGFTNIFNTTISQNNTTNDSATVGGVFHLSVLPQISRLNLDSVTLAENSDSGFGIQAINPGAARANFRNTVFAYNSGPLQCRSVGNGSIEYESSGYNLSTDGSCRPSEPTDMQDTDPLLGQLLEDHYEAASTSPILDSGSTTQAFDQLGRARPVDLPDIPNTADGDDRGAIELQSAGPTAITLGSVGQMPVRSIPLFILVGIGSVTLLGWFLRPRLRQNG